MKSPHLLLGSVLVLVGTAWWSPAIGRSAEIFLGSGAKVGEMSSTTAIVHVRLTALPEQDEEGRIPGREGQARVLYGLDASLAETKRTDWRAVKADEDYSGQFPLVDLQPGRRYHYRVEYRADGQSPSNTSDTFSFKTAPAATERAAVKFQVTTGQDVRGAETYRMMAAQQPDFLVSTGDNVYYDGPAQAHDVAGAFRAYQQMYGLPPMKAYFQHVGGYFEKDDHDYRFNDSDPWMTYFPGEGEAAKKKKRAKAAEKWLSHEEGIRVFKVVFPMSPLTYRTFHWGQGLQIWLVEGRDYRSPNAMPDGPDKSIWGKEQMAWLKRTLLESDADFRVLISPTPIIGPDRVSKIDNHADPKGFWTEGQAFLDWIRDQKLDNLVLMCGDRHWQYHSIDRRQNRRIHEFSCGPTCDEHTQQVPPIAGPFQGITQPYAASRGGILTVTYQPDRTLTCEFFGQDGTSVYKYTLEGPN